VHEEGAASPDWGDRLTPDIVSAITKKQLLPVLELDGGFVRPQYPTQVLVSYYEAGKICDYIVQRWGDAAILGMIHAYAARKTTSEAIEENLHENAAAFDKDFSAWLDEKTAKTVKNFDDWKKTMKTAQADLQSGKREEAIKQGNELLNYYPDYVGHRSAYEFVAEAYIGMGDKASAMHELEKYRDVGGTGVEVLKKLAGMEFDSGNKKQAQLTLAKLNNIYPEDEEIHRRLGGLLLESGDAEGAVREGKALVALRPNDVAESHYELAKALNAAHRVGEAKDQVVLALEAAPSFKPAQQLLLQLSQ
jgi:tetratricopeptide (TPR) repeat protein